MPTTFLFLLDQRKYKNYHHFKISLIDCFGKEIILVHLEVTAYLIAIFTLIKSKYLCF